MSSSFEYDLLIIGAGPGGLAAAQRAAHHGARVAIVEQNALGGTCINRGCVPKKLMVYAADIGETCQVGQGYGWTIHGQLDWSTLIAAIHRHLDHLTQRYQQKLRQAGVHLIRGHATFCDPHTIAIDDQARVTADRVIIAVGGQPQTLDIPGQEHLLTSRDMFHLEQFPQRLIIIGGGYIGVEFGSLMQGLGAQVTVIERSELILEGFDQDIRTTVQHQLIDRGLEIIGNSTVKSIEAAAGTLELTVATQSDQEKEQTRTRKTDVVLCATGRSPNVKGLGLEQAGVAVKDGAIGVDNYSRTSQDNIFAVGDCTDRVLLTPVAKAEGHAVAETLFGKQPRSVDYHYVPSAVFTRPEAATVGLTEAEAREQFGEAVHIHCAQFQPLLQSLTQSKQQNLIKVVTQGNEERVVGLHVVGQDAAEIVQGVAVAIRLGMTKADLDETIGIHPTLGEELFSMA